MKYLILTLLGISAVTSFIIQNDNVLETLLSRKISAEARALTGKALVEYLQKNQQFFKAEESKFSMKSMKAKLMNTKYLMEPPRGEELSIDIEIPTSFDSRIQWPQCSSIKKVRDQSDCGSCWAFGAAEAISDRTCIASNGTIQVTISADDLLSCCGRYCGDGCEGGFPIEAWRYWTKAGICTGGPYDSKTGCKPYQIPPCGHHKNETYYGPCPKTEYDTPKCEKKCQAGYQKSYNDDKYYGKSAYGVRKSVSAIQKEILKHGPVEAAYTVYEDFYQYKGGIYVHTAGEELGGHAVKIIGWGVENKVPYWIVANSWSADWGENGFFRIVRGVDECGMESAIVAGIPKV